MTDPRIEAMLSSLQSFEAVLSGQSRSQAMKLDVILDAHLHTRKQIASIVGKIAQSDLPNAIYSMSNALNSVVDKIRQDLATSVDPSHIRIRGYRGVQAILLEYLLLHEGKNVAGDRLRAVIGDQIHTERRIRDLRDLGFDVPHHKEQGTDYYCLTSRVQNLPFAARAILTKVLKKHRADFTDREIVAIEKYLSS